MKIKRINAGYLLVVSAFLFLGSCQQPEIKGTVKSELQADSSWMKLTVREKIGQLICINYNKAQLAEFGEHSIQSFLQKYPVGSVFMANWELGTGVSDDSIKHVYRKLISDFASASKYPMLFTEDFETGLGTVLPDYTQLPGEMALGAANSSQLAFLYGQIMAEEARSIGLNWLLHPVADLNINPFNYLTNVRAVSDDASRAIRILPAQIRGMQSKRVAATAKHFPGGGTDFINQHFCTSQMKLSYQDWQQQHGKVFQTAIDSGVMVIMPGHISFPDYQKEQLRGEYLPATLSKELLTGLLKEKMAFKGVIVSDALNMAGIAGFYENQLETEVECFKAGTDILLWPELRLIDTLEARILRKEIPMERLNDAVSRVWNLKKKLGLFEKDYPTIKPLAVNALEQNKASALRIAEKSITLLSNKNNLIPLDTLSSKNILLVVISENEPKEVFSVLQKQFTQKGYNVDQRHNLSFFAHANQLENIAKQYDKVIFAFYSLPGNPWGALSLRGEQALSMWSANKLPSNQVISLCFGEPYKNLIYMPRTWCRLNCYNSDENSQEAMVKALIGEIDLSGTSPLRKP